ncbi:hypothetical protein NE237_027285 [Protea cynaroides]|uniref:Uncharacterized protein n=1 Tax=Protea cynaroides TaxID=273540 RepID=A0A9Q0GPV1_9MAGN|nr:hypothetical protein NE237_027285 [Protea cynaroides]
MSLHPIMLFREPMGSSGKICLECDFLERWRRAWILQRLALLWGRKGGVFKRRLMIDLRLLPSYLKSLHQNPDSESIHYRERQFSFNNTRIFHFKTHRSTSMRFHIPSQYPACCRFRLQ